jgi:hypothetical protein
MSKLTFDNIKAIAEALVHSKAKIEVKGKGIMTSCPCEGHGKGMGDEHPSLRLYLTSTGYLGAICRAGCSYKDIKAAIRARGLLPEKSGKKSEPENTAGNIGEDIAGNEIVYLPYAPVGTEPPLDFKHAQFGKPQKTWVYRDCVGRIRGVVYRWDGVGRGKEFFQFRWGRWSGGGEGWHWEGARIRGLYGEELLDERPSAAVLVVSGEKTCDAARKLFPDHVVMTWSGGDGAADLPDWSVLEHRDVILWPDADNSSRIAMRRAAWRLTRQGSKSVRLVDPPAGLEPGWDLADLRPVDLDLRQLLRDASPWTTNSQAKAREEFAKAVIESEEDKADLLDEFNQEFAVVGESRPMVYQLLLLPDGLELRRVSSQTIKETAFYSQRVAIVSGDHVKYITPGKFWYDHPERKTYPNGPIFWVKGETPPGCYNMFKGFAVEPDPNGDCSLFETHLRQNICSDTKEHYDWVMGWFAHAVQRPMEKPGVALILISLLQGVGKTATFVALGQLWGPHYQLFNDFDMLVSRFNARLASVIMVYVDEIGAIRNAKDLAKFKSMITCIDMLAEQKFVDAVKMRSYHRFGGSSNRLTNLPLEPEGRRIALLETKPDWTDEIPGTLRRRQKPIDYEGSKVPAFVAMFHQLEQRGGYGKLLHTLQTWDLTGWRAEEFPHTEALREYHRKHLSPVLQFYRWILTEHWTRYFGSDSSRKTMVEKDLLYHNFCDEWLKTSSPMTREKFHQELQSAWPDELFEERDGKRQVVMSRVGSKNDRSWCYNLLTVEKHREAFRQKTNVDATPPKAKEVEQGELYKEETNVTPFPGKGSKDPPF